MGEGSVHNYGIHAEVHFVQVGLGDAYAYMGDAQGLAAGFGKLDAVNGYGSADIRRKHVVHIAGHIQVCAQRTFEILILDKVVEVGLGDGESQLVERDVYAEVLCLHVELHLDAQVATIGELEVHADIGVLVAEVDGGNGDGEVLDVDFRAYLQVFVNDIAFFQRDVFDRNAKANHFIGVEVQSLSGIDCRGCLGGFFLSCGGVGRGIGGELVQNVAEVEFVALLCYAGVESFQVDFADADFFLDQVCGVHVNAELFEGHEGGCAVRFVDGEIIDGDCKRERAEFHVFDFHLATDDFFGVVDDVVLGDAGGYLECGEDDNDQCRKNDKGDVTFLHDTLKIEFLICRCLLIFFRTPFSIFIHIMENSSLNNDSLNVLILAAGLGTRLRPLTNDVPKPLVPVVDASILDLQARKARQIGNIRLHANAHYLADQVVVAGKTLGFEKVWVELPDILGTAGPLKRIYNEGYRGGLLIMNGDAYCDFDLKAFVKNAQERAAQPNGPQVALLAVDFPKVNTFRVGPDGRLAGVVGRFGSEEGLPATFSGVSWYSDEALARIRDGEFDIREFWKQEIAAGRAPFVDMTQLHATWIDMGSPEGLMSAVEARLKELGRNENEAVVEEGVQVPAGVTIKHSVIYDGAEIESGETIENEIRGRGFKWKV